MESFGHYKILERLGSGGIGEVCRARDARMGRTVALRLVAPAIAGDPLRRDALLADAALAAALSHPHIAALFDFGEEDGRVYLAHEYVTGGPLEALLAGRPFDVTLALEFAVQLADALAEAHRQGIVHGDLRPWTIFVTPAEQTKVVDFGLSNWTTGGVARKTFAERLGSGQAADIPAGQLAAYLSPEQVLGGRIDHRTDIFSLGVILYQMLTGRSPFLASTATETAMNVLQLIPPAPTCENPALPAEFDRIITRALAKSLEGRYPDAATMAADLRAMAARLDVPVSARTIHWKNNPKGERPRRMRRRLLVAAIVLAVVGGLGAAAWYARTAIRHLVFPEPPAPRTVVVVLPFSTPPGDTSRPYYGYGFSEDLAGRLGEVSGLRVVGRTTIREAPGPSAAALAKRLDAAVVLKGTVRPGPYSLRVSVQLVDAVTGRSIWSDEMSREPRQAFGVQAEIARQVADQLRLPMPTGNRWAAAMARQIDPAAYDIYLQARDANAHRDRSRAVALYRQALQLDHRLVEARVGLSESLYLDDFYAGVDANTADEARQQADAALAVDPEMPRAHLVAALSAPTPVGAASALSRALALDPSSGEAWHHAGDLVLDQDPERALSFYRHSLSLEPGIDATHRDIAAALELLNRLPEAEQAVNAGQAARPDRPWWAQMRARFAILQHQYDSAVRLLADDPATESSPIVWLVGRVIPLRLASRTEEARKEATDLVTVYPSYCEGRAVLAGLEWDTNARQQGRTTADAVFSQASAANVLSVTLPCAAMAAAAVGDAAQAANYLSRTAADDRALRLWTRHAVFSLNLVLRRQWYPWDKVAGSAPVQQATAELDQSLQRVRAEIARRLPSPPAAAPAAQPAR
ncbi:MAG TPA: protein kinase [Vicinamibacterales bacterium]|jgi:TolB-like protein